MTRHIADHQTAESTGRLVRFAGIERAQQPEGSHPAAKSVHARTATRVGDTRLPRYVKIDKGAEA